MVRVVLFDVRLGGALLTAAEDGVPDAAAAQEGQQQEQQEQAEEHADDDARDGARAQPVVGRRGADRGQHGTVGADGRLEGQRGGGGADLGHGGHGAAGGADEGRVGGRHGAARGAGRAHALARLVAELAGRAAGAAALGVAHLHVARRVAALRRGRARRHVGDKLAVGGGDGQEARLDVGGRVDLVLAVAAALRRPGSAITTSGPALRLAAAIGVAGLARAAAELVVVAAGHGAALPDLEGCVGGGFMVGSVEGVVPRERSRVCSPEGGEESKGDGEGCRNAQ